jgi:very-short-patch-repair endonuclease
LDLQVLDRSEAVLDRAIGQLAEVAAGLWPHWFGGEDFSELNDDALSHKYLPIKLAEIASRSPGISIGWAEAAIRQVLRRRAPHVGGVSRDMEWSQLCRAINPNGLISVATIDETSPDKAWPLVHAFEWLGAKGNVAMVILCPNPPPHEPPFDRLLFGARAVVVPIGCPTRENRSNGIPASSPELEAEPPFVDLVLPPVYGRPHPLSPIEQRLSKMLEADAELAPKFAFNARVQDVSLKSPKVDLLWAEGRLVIELDGAEHRGRRAYREDRHRDYELLCAGYLVVRIANDEIVEDFGRTIEKIRSAVRAAQVVKGELNGR